MFGLGAPELVVILAIVLIVFGAGKLPQIGGALGRSIREFRESSEGKGNDPAPVEPAPGDKKTNA